MQDRETIMCHALSFESSVYALSVKMIIRMIKWYCTLPNDQI